MATRASVEDHVLKAVTAIEEAEKQLDMAKRQEHFNDVEYSDAQLSLEQIDQQLSEIMNSANQEQKERLYRTQLQVRQMQQHMILNQF